MDEMVVIPGPVLNCEPVTEIAGCNILEKFFVIHIYDTSGRFVGFADKIFFTLDGAQDWSKNFYKTWPNDRCIITQFSAGHQWAVQRPASAADDCDGTCRTCGAELSANDSLDHCPDAKPARESKCECVDCGCHG